MQDVGTKGGVKHTLEVWKPIYTDLFLDGLSLPLNHRPKANSGLNVQYGASQAELKKRFDKRLLKLVEYIYFFLHSLGFSP